MADVQSGTILYRVVSLAEYQDLVTTGRFRQGQNSLEGKWFADTLEGVARHAANLYKNTAFKIVKAEIPADLLTRSYRPANHDRCGPATYVDRGDLPLISPILESDDEG
jgi:hypothetical protein